MLEDVALKLNHQNIRTLIKFYSGSGAILGAQRYIANGDMSISWSQINIPGNLGSKMARTTLQTVLLL